MKKVLFILSLIIGCSCSSEIPFDKDGAENAVTRSANDSVYYLGFTDSDIVEDFAFTPKGTTQPVGRTLLSYVEVNGIKTVLQPEIVSKPSWVNYAICSQYNEIYVLLVMTEDNISSLRSGSIVLKQPISNKTLTIGITQNGINNYIRVSVEQTYNNRYLFTATSTYPVKGEVRVRVPFEVYNDGGKLDHGALMVIPKGEQTGTYLMDFNASPLVCYHGDLKGYNLFEGNITGDDVYTYEFYRYW